MHSREKDDHHETELDQPVLILSALGRSRLGSEVEEAPKDDAHEHAEEVVLQSITSSKMEAGWSALISVLFYLTNNRLFFIFRDGLEIFSRRITYWNLTLRSLLLQLWVGNAFRCLFSTKV